MQSKGKLVRQHSLTVQTSDMTAQIQTDNNAATKDKKEVMEIPVEFSDDENDDEDPDFNDLELLEF